MIFYHSRLAEDPTSMTVSLWFLWFLSTPHPAIEMSKKKKKRYRVLWGMSGEGD